MRTRTASDNKSKWVMAVGNERVLREIASLFPFAHEEVLLWGVEDMTTCISLGSVMDATNHKDTKATWGPATH